MILVRVAGTRTISVIPFCGWTPRVQLIFIFKWSKRPLDSGGGRCDHHHLYLSEQCFGTISKKYRHCSEQYQRNTDIIPKLFDIVPKVYFAGFSSFSSYQKDNLISCAHFAHLIGKAMWAGSRRPTPKSMGQNGPLIFLRNNTEKSRWYCSEYSSAYCSEYSSDSAPRPDKLVNFLSHFCTILQ